MIIKNNDYLDGKIIFSLNFFYTYQLRNKILQLKLQKLLLKKYQIKQESDEWPNLEKDCWYHQIYRLQQVEHIQFEIKQQKLNLLLSLLKNFVFFYSTYHTNKKNHLFCFNIFGGMPYWL